MNKILKCSAAASIVALICIFASARSQDLFKPVPEKMKAGFDGISPIDSYGFLEFIAADEMEGRETPGRGEKVARNYIQSLYKSWGVRPLGDKKGDSRSYEQSISMFIKKIGPATSLEVQSATLSRKFVYGSDFDEANGADFPGVIEAQVVFAGYGISAPDLGYDDFAKLDVKNKMVLIAIGLPGGPEKDTVFNKPANRARFAGRFTPAENCSRLMAQKGALALMICDPSLDSRTSSPYIPGNRIMSSGHEVVARAFAAAKPLIPTFWVSPRIAEAIFGMDGRSFQQTKQAIDDAVRPNSMALNNGKMRLALDAQSSNASSANLLGLVEGSDPVLKNEYVIIGAHLDHTGMNEAGYVFRGADDNGSGSVGVLQLAKAFAANPVKPKRSIIFAHWTGEEKGLLGSGHFTEFPTVPYERIVACLNLDMICRNTPLAVVKSEAKTFEVKPEDIALLKDEPEKLLMAFTSSPSPALADLIKQLNGDYLGLSVVPLPSFPMLGNSDHYFFCLKKTPSVFIYTGSTPDTHQPTDAVEKINAEKMSRVVKLTYLLAFHIGDNPERLGWKANRP